MKRIETTKTNPYKVKQIISERGSTTETDKIK